MTADIIPFRYENARDLRVAMIDGEPWFVASDLAALLGYRMASDLTRNLDEDERGTHRLQAQRRADRRLPQPAPHQGRLT